MTDMNTPYIHLDHAFFITDDGCGRYQASGTGKLGQGGFFLSAWQTSPEEAMSAAKTHIESRVQ